MGQRVYAGLSAQDRVAQRRERFLAAGLEVFAEAGWAGSSVTDICRTAGLSPRFFYELFDSREDLFLAVSGRIAEQIEQTVRAVAGEPAGGPGDRARAVLTALAAYFTADPRTVRVALMESLATPRFRRHRRELLDSVNVLAARLMHALRDDPPDEHTQAVLRVSAGILTGGLVELLVARATAPTGPAAADPFDLDGLVEHLTAVYTAVARL
jgi:AcrR family transcriptional regulator